MVSRRSPIVNPNSRPPTGFPPQLAPEAEHRKKGQKGCPARPAAVQLACIRRMAREVSAIAEAMCCASEYA